MDTQVHFNGVWHRGPIIVIGAIFAVVYLVIQGNGTAPLPQSQVAHNSRTHEVQAPKFRRFYLSRVDRKETEYP